MVSRKFCHTSLEADSRGILCGLPAFCIALRNAIYLKKRDFSKKRDNIQYWRKMLCLTSMGNFTVQRNEICA